MTNEPTETAAWEASCRVCGRCCFEKIEDERGTIFYTQTPCRYLDVVTRQCQIYDKRFEINPECIKLTPELVEQLHWLPRDCGYVKGREHGCREPLPARPSRKRKKGGR